MIETCLFPNMSSQNFQGSSEFPNTKFTGRRISASTSATSQHGYWLLSCRQLRSCAALCQISRRLVLGCIDSYDSNQILIFSGFSRSIKLFGYIFKILPKFAKNQRFSQKSALFAKIRSFRNFLKILCANFAIFSKNQVESFVDFEKCCKMCIWLPDFVSIQP